jgi:hypothetical protein
LKIKGDYSHNIINAKAMYFKIRAGKGITCKDEFPVFTFPKFDDFTKLATQNFDEATKNLDSKNPFCMQGGFDNANDTGCYMFASFIDILSAQGFKDTTTTFMNEVEVADGFHFYYNNDAGPKMAPGEAFDINNSTLFESMTAEVKEGKIVNNA